MKTNQLMKRRMGNIDVTQRTKTDFLCIRIVETVE